MLTINQLNSFCCEGLLRRNHGRNKVKPVELHNYAFKHGNQTYPLVLSMMKSDLLSDDGIKIGFVFASPSSKFHFFYPAVYGEKGGFQMFDLSSSTSAQLSEFGWAFINPSAVYDSVELWNKNKK